MFGTNDQEGIFLKMDGELRRMLDDIRRDLQLSRKKAPEDDAGLVKQILREAHKALLEGLGYPAQDSAQAAARLNRGLDGSVEMGDCSASEKIAAMFGHSPEWVESQNRLAARRSGDGS